jgi:ParB family chromosome partitioning protein
MPNPITPLPLRSPAPEPPSGDGGAPKSSNKRPGGMSRLGRGLGALIPPPSARPITPSATPHASQTPPSSGSVTPGPGTPGSVTRGSATPNSVSSAAVSAGETVPASTGGQTAIASPLVAPASTTPSPASASPVASTVPTATRASTAEPKDVSTSRSTWNTATDQSILSIPIARIQRNPRQPRERFDDAALRALADSIRQDGLLQPIVVRPVKGVSGSDDVQLFELVAGERRLRAFTLLGRSAIPAVVHTIDDKSSAVLALIENVQREDLNPMERAHGLQRLMHEFDLSQQDLASRVGLDRSTVANLLRLNDLDPHTASALQEGTITTGHAKALLGLSDVPRRKVLLTRAIAEGWSVRELEKEARLVASSGAGQLPRRLPGAGRVISAQLADLERRLSTHLGTGVQLKAGRKPGSGAITISFASHSQFEGLMERVGFDLDGSDRPPGR